MYSKKFHSLSPEYSLKLEAFLLGIAVLAGLGGAAGAGETVVDAAGRDVAVPGKVDRLAITCYGGTTHEVAVLGCAEKIVAQRREIGRASCRERV